MRPPEFPKAFPCCVKIGEEIVASYILLRLKEIVWLLEENQCFLHGIVEYLTDEDLDDEIDFLEKITRIEEYFSEIIEVPEKVTSGEWNVIVHLYNLINGEYRGDMNTVNFTFELSDENRERFLELTDRDYVIAYTAEGVFSVFDKKFILPIFREYKLVKIDNLERLKKKVDILDNGDQLKIVYVPGTNKTTCNYVDKIRTEEIGSGLLFSS